jgi:hypothetical protein
LLTLAYRAGIFIWVLSLVRPAGLFVLVLSRALSDEQVLPVLPQGHPGGACEHKRRADRVPSVCV